MQGQWDRKENSGMKLQKSKSKGYKCLSPSKQKLHKTKDWGDEKGGMEATSNKENPLEISVKAPDLQVECLKGEEKHEKGNGKRSVTDEYDEPRPLMKSMKTSKEDMPMGMKMT
uniref:Uncharacterized protein n=1 Tax=Magallana gigas TaxID=29159 RepID=K1PXG2_MAGGI